MSQSFECPITLERMADPVIAADGYTYERSAIEEHFRIHGPRSPLSNASLPHTTLVPNRALKDLIEQETPKIVQAETDKKKETNSGNVLQRFSSFVTDAVEKLFSGDKNMEDYFEGLLQRYSTIIEVEDQLSAVLKKALPKNIAWKNPTLLKRIELSLTITMLLCWAMFQPSEVIIVSFLMGFNFLECYVAFEYPAICSVENVSAVVVLLSVLAWNSSHHFSSASRKILGLILPFIISERGKSKKVLEINELGGNMVCTCIFLLKKYFMTTLSFAFVFGGAFYGCYLGNSQGQAGGFNFITAWICHILFSAFAFFSGKLPLNLTSTIIFMDWVVNIVAFPCLDEFKKEKPAWLDFFSFWTNSRTKLLWFLFAFGLNFCLSGGHFSDVANSFYFSVFTLLPSVTMLSSTLLMSVVVSFFNRKMGSMLLLYWEVLCIKYCID